MLKLVSMTLTLMQGHSGSANAHTQNQRCMLSVTQQAISIKPATKVGHFLRDFDLDFAKMYIMLSGLFILFKLSYHP